MKSTNINNTIKEVRELLMRLEVIFLAKKQKKLEKNFIKKRLFTIF